MSPISKLHRIPAQQTTDDLVIEGPVISATCTEAETSAEKKQKDAEKPLYLKRV
jgi:hypothetical protein